MNVHLDDIFSTAEPFVTKLGTHGEAALWARVLYEKIGLLF